MKRIHATSIAIKGRGVLLRGASGSGKSDLALRLMDDGADLVADDYTEVHAERGELIATAPKTIQGLLEVRGVGILNVGHITHVPVVAVFDLVSLSEIERLPQPQTESIEGVDIAHYCLHGFDASAPAKVRIALMAQAENLFQAP